MSTALRVGGFVAVLAVLFGAAFGVGRVFEDEEAAVAAPAERYALELEATEVPADPAAPTRFRILDQNGDPVTRFALRHEKRLHLIAVDEDFGGFQHVHPTMAEDGTWTTSLALYAGGWRLFADFQEDGADEAVVSEELRARGADDRTTGAEPPEVSRTAFVDGYQVSLAGDLTPGAGSTTSLSVTKDGQPVTDLQPYLGAYGHLVVLRGTDKQYLHAHPEDGPAGPEITFHVEVPTQDRYYLYLDFKHDGKVRTAQFALDATTTAGGDDDEHGGEHGDH